MKTPLELQRVLTTYVEEQQDRLLEIARELIRMPSENIPPGGAEQACQTWIAAFLRQLDLEPDLYLLDEVADLAEHPLFFPGRDYAGRPNLGARRKGMGGGRSLLLTGHIDTVPVGTQDWTRDPFGGEVEGNRIYGRGANDMKGGVAANLFVMQAVAELGLSLKGELIFETVVDEEFGGSNGTLAGRLRGFNADAAILAEPSSLRICPAQRGGLTAHVTFRCGTGGVLHNGHFARGIVPQLAHFLAGLPAFESLRRAHVQVHEMYAGNADPVPVSVTKIVTSPWGYAEPITIPNTAQLELYWQLMPGEAQNDAKQQFFGWLEHIVRSAREIFPATPEVTFPLRWLPGSAIDRSEPLIQELSACAETVLGATPVVAGIEGPCDLFIFHNGFNIPAALWGPRGGNTHAADEFVEIDSLLSAAKTLLLFVAEWCGTDKG